MKKRRTRRLLGRLALPVLTIFSLHVEAVAAGMQLAQSSAPAAPEQPAPATSGQTQDPATGQAQEPQPSARPACLDQFGSVLDESGILFNHASSHLRREEVPAIDRLAEYAKSCPEARFQLDGHTDSAGSQLYNQFLSEQRVKTVIGELEERGVDASRLSPATGHGETQPTESKCNWSREGRQANRRVEIIMTE